MQILLEKIETADRLSFDELDNLREASEYDCLRDVWENYRKLSPIQQNVLTLIVSGKQIRQISRDFKIDESTIYKWMQLEIFRETLNKWQFHTFQMNRIKLNQLAEQAIARMSDVFANPKEYDSKTLEKCLELTLKSTGILK